MSPHKPVPLDKLVRLAGNSDKSIMERVLALLYADKFYGGNAPVNPEAIAEVLGIPESEVHTAIEALQVRGLIEAAP